MARIFSIAQNYRTKVIEATPPVMFEGCVRFLFGEDFVIISVLRLPVTFHMPAHSDDIHWNRRHPGH